MQHLLERAQELYGPHPAGEFWVPHRLGGGAPSLAEAARLDAEEARLRAARRAPKPPGRRSSNRWRSRPSAPSRSWPSWWCWPPAPGSPTCGEENIPDRGGAVIAINHTSYVDFLPAALAVYRRHRRLRFMIKAEMQQVKVVNFLIKRTGTIPVDRDAGAGAYAVAVQRLREGELVGVYPEATISRSFELKEFKTGAARMAVEAGVPIVPLIVWGAHRIWTKDHPRQIGRNKMPITVQVGAPVRRDQRHRRYRRRAARVDDRAAAPGAGAIIRTRPGRIGCRAGWAAARRRWPRRLRWRPMRRRRGPPAVRPSAVTLGRRRRTWQSRFTGSRSGSFRPWSRCNGTKFTFQGLENIPARGGALLAQNHTSYLDWLPTVVRRT